MDKYGKTPLHQAATHGHKEVAVVLIACDADINQKCYHGKTALDVALSNAIKVLLQNTKG